jgi:hypothetical protein
VYAKRSAALATNVVAGFPKTPGGKSRVKFETILLSAFLLAVGHAATIVTTFGPGQSFTSPPGQTIGGGILRGDPPPNTGVTQAFGFVPGTSSQLGQIDLALQYLFLAGIANGPANLDVAIANDNLGQPGTPLETIHLMNVLGGIPFHPGIVTATSSTHPLLMAGTSYWLVVAPPDLLHTAFDWLISPINPLPTPFASRLGNSAWVTGVTPQPLAFDVVGVGASAVPEPWTWTLMGTGLAALGLFRKGKPEPKLRSR